MNWAALIAVILEFFGPIIRKWLEDLFDRVPPGPVPNGTTSAVEKLFEAARAETSWWQFRRRSVLVACQKVAMSRAGEFLVAVKGGSKPVMSKSEQEVVAKAM